MGKEAELIKAAKTGDIRTLEKHLSHITRRSSVIGRYGIQWLCLYIHLYMWIYYIHHTSIVYDSIVYMYPVHPFQVDPFINIYIYVHPFKVTLLIHLHLDISI